MCVVVVCVVSFIDTLPGQVCVCVVVVVCVVSFINALPGQVCVCVWLLYVLFLS